jgi:hypothetical protein
MCSIRTEIKRHVDKETNRSIILGRVEKIKSGRKRIKSSWNV